MRKQTGFTVLELLMVITIIAVFTAMMTPSFLKWLQARRLVVAAADVNSAIRLARLNAVKRNTSAVLQFDVGNEAYVITVAGDPVKRGRMPAGVDLFDVYLSSTSISAPGGAITFDSRGFPSPPVDVVLQDTAGTIRTIQVSLTGGSRII